MSGVPISQIKHKREFDDLSLRIETDAWIGYAVIIVKGVAIGCGAVVGSGSVVTKNIPPYAIAVGVPDRVIGCRGDKNTIQTHEQKIYEPKNQVDLNSIPFSAASKN